MRFWPNVVELLKGQRRSIRSLGRAIGVSATALSNYGRGAVPSLDIASRIADELDVSLDWLVAASPGDPPEKRCPSPQDHTLLRELVDEMGMKDMLLLSRLSSLAVALEVAELLKTRHPAPVTLDAIRGSIKVASDDVLEATLLALKKKRVIDEADHDGRRCFSFRKSVNAFHWSESSELALNMKRAARLLFTEVLPAQEAEEPTCSQ